MPLPILTPTRRDFIAAAATGAVASHLLGPINLVEGSVSGATLHFYESGTLHPAAIFHDAACAQPCGSVLAATPAGRFPAAFLDPARLYRAILRNASGAVVADVDPVVDSSAATISYVQSGAGAVRRTIEARLRDSLSLADFGYRGDARTDDGDAWRAAIAAAVGQGISVIEIPWGAAGISLVAQPLVDGPLAPGLRFVGKGRGSGSYDRDRPKLVYTGAGVCWNIRYPDYTPPETGDWLWESMIFETLDPRASMFSFNDPQTHDPVDGSGYSYLRNAAFRNILALGGAKTAAQSGRQTGDFLQAAKLFHLEIDGQSMIAGWRRGLWLKGCDNSRISGRFAQNNRHIMIQRSGSFANNNLIDSRFLGPIALGGVEDPYLLWDNGFATTIVSPFLEETDGAPHAAHALVYLDGFGARLIAPLLAGAPLFRLGPNARECLLDGPQSTIFNARWAPVIDDPASWDFGYNQGDYRLVILNARENMQRMIGRHPRILFFNATRGFDGVLGTNQLTRASASGLQAETHICHALNYWGRSRDLAASGGIKGIARDAAASNGWAIQLDGAATRVGFELLFVVGREILPGWFRLSCRTRRPSGGAGEQWGVALLRNGSFVQRGAMSPAPGGYHLAFLALDGSAWAPGDQITLQVMASASTADLFLDFIELRPVEAPAAPPAAASGAQDVEARAAIGQVLDILRARGLMA